MKIPAPNEENENSTESVNISQGNSSVNSDESGLDFGEIVADTVELVSSFFED